MTFCRTAALDRIKQTTDWDIVIIGGGATGLGIAVDAASRGYRTLLLEKHDFAKGTSSKSTKLVHGGVRYLAQGNVKLVYGALRERGLIFQNAPHVSFVQSFVIPTYSLWDKWKFIIGLKLYDWMAGSLRIGKSVIRNKQEVLSMLPTLQPKGLLGGIQYFDGQFDDARLAINLAQTAAEHGATLLNYADVINITKNKQSYVSGLSFTDRTTQQSYTISAKAVINATGVFVDDILKMDSPSHTNLVRPSQGTHIVIDKHFLGDKDALMIPKTSDGRVLFGVPWHDKVLLGTTDTPLEQHQIEPKPLEEEIDFILKTASQYLTQAPQRKDIRTIFAGLRPLAAPTKDKQSTKEISRDHKLIQSSSRMITITGGKWTTYRKMAEETVDLAVKTARLPEQPCQTKHLPIHGATSTRYEGHWQVYGDDYPRIVELMQTHPSSAEKLHPDYDFRMAEVIWACQHEMVVKLEDFLARRIRFLLLDAKASLEAAPKVAKLMAEQLGKDEQWIAAELSDYQELVETYIV